MCGHEPPTILTEFRLFLGLCNIFRQFVPNFARVGAFLNKKLPKGQAQTFDELSDEKVPALEMLKAKLVEPRVLTLPRTPCNIL